MIVCSQELKDSSKFEFRSTDTDTDNETASTSVHRNIQINYRYYPEVFAPETAVIIINVPFSSNSSSSLVEYLDYSQNSTSVDYADYELIADNNDTEYTAVTEVSFSESRLIDDRQETDVAFDLETNDSLEVTNQSSNTDSLFDSESVGGSNHTNESLKMHSESKSFLQLFFITFCGLMVIYVIGLSICSGIAKIYPRQSGRIEEHIEMVDLF